MASPRNSFAGIATGVRVDDVAAQVEAQAGPPRPVSPVTREAVEEPGPAVDFTATARAKSTGVRVGPP
ncbi:hypothetical protein [Streptomyces griseus]|uniref:hypothetical protein n=1 Tax=Streptomyces griseus TaxID=1911 RepID=UPI000A64F926|nr:hypothetical protein [Streptomyces griseus]